MKRTIVLIGMAVVFCSPPVKAELITIKIEGVVDYVGDPYNYLEGKIIPGDIITGSYTYDSTTHDSNPSPYIGMYEHYTSPYGIKLSIGEFVFQSDPDNVDFLVSVGNAGGTYDRDNYLIRSHNNLPSYDNILINDIMWQLDDKSGTAVSSDALPVTAPVLEDWPDSFTGLRITAGDIKDSLRITSNVTSAIPEPCTILLFGVAALFLRKRS